VSNILETEAGAGLRLKTLSLLFEISQTFEKSMDLNEVIQPVLRLVAEHTGAMRGTLTILNRNTGEISIDTAYGLSTSQLEKGKYKLGEGVTGRVVQSGQPMIVPRVSQEPMFLNRTGARSGLEKKDISFICVPIKAGQETIGALSVDRLFDESVSLKQDMKMLEVIE
jgi:Nif-specific regulatory protein